MSNPYYANLKQSTFGGLPRTFKGSVLPHVMLSMDRPFNATTPFVAYDLMVEMFQESGVEVHPIAMTQEDAGTKLVLTVANPDWEEKPYKDIFPRFGVTRAQFINQPH